MPTLGRQRHANCWLLKRAEPPHCRLDIALWTTRQLQHVDESNPFELAKQHGSRFVLTHTDWSLNQTNRSTPVCLEVFYPRYRTAGNWVLNNKLAVVRQVFEGRKQGYSASSSGLWGSCLLFARANFKFSGLHRQREKQLIQVLIEHSHHWTFRPAPGHS